MLLQRLRARIRGLGSEEVRSFQSLRQTHLVLTKPALLFRLFIQYGMCYRSSVVNSQKTQKKKKRHSAQIIPSLEPHIRHAAIESYADALRVVFICQAAIGLLGILPCLVIDESPRLCVRDTTA